MSEELTTCGVRNVACVQAATVGTRLQDQSSAVSFDHGYRACRGRQNFPFAVNTQASRRERWEYAPGSDGENAYRRNTAAVARLRHPFARNGRSLEIRSLHEFVGARSGDSRVWFAHKSGGLTNAEISERFKMATSTSSYILHRLEREGYLRRDRENGRYEMGLKIVALSHGALRDMGLRRAAEPILHRLSAESRTSALIAVLERGMVMIVDKVEKPDLARIDMDIGVRYPAHSTALGKVLLAHLPQHQLLSLFDHYGLTKKPHQKQSIPRAACWTSYRLFRSKATRSVTESFSWVLRL